MKFLFIISHDDEFAPTERLIEEIHDWISAAEKKGQRLDGNPLRPASEAVTVRVRRGKTKRSPGPFAATDEKMCAYELVDCATAEEAYELAATHPMARVATIEVRPLWPDL